MLGEASPLTFHISQNLALKSKPMNEASHGQDSGVHFRSDRSNPILMKRFLRVPLRLPTLELPPPPKKTTQQQQQQHNNNIKNMCYVDKGRQRTIIPTTNFSSRGIPHIKENFTYSQYLVLEKESMKAMFRQDRGTS